MRLLLRRRPRAEIRRFPEDAGASVSFLIPACRLGSQIKDMNWKAIRLELGRTRDFPNGSPSRAYLLRLPLDENGLVDEVALRTSPTEAILRRCWPNEPDMAGYVVPANGGWAFSQEPGEDDQANIFCHERRPIRIGESLMIVEPDGNTLPFHVASLEAAD